MKTTEKTEAADLRQPIMDCLIRLIEEKQVPLNDYRSIHELEKYIGKSCFPKISERVFNEGFLDSLAILEADGLVVQLSDQFVIPIVQSEKCLFTLSQRYSVESAAAERLASGDRDYDHDALEAAHAAVDQSFSDYRGAEAAKHDTLFHANLLSLANYGYATLRIHAWRNTVRLYRIGIDRPLATDRHAIRLEHRQIYESINSGDPPRAAAAVRTHINHTIQRLNLEPQKGTGWREKFDELRAPVVLETDKIVGRTTER